VRTRLSVFAGPPNNFSERFALPAYKRQSRSARCEAAEQVCPLYGGRAKRARK
jgi:hypothetical protein